MGIEVLVISAETYKVGRIRLDEKEILPEEEAVGVRLKEVFNSVTESIAGSLEVESNLTIEISGSLGISVEGKTKYLFFNVGGQAEVTGAMKITLSTTVKPKLELGKSQST